MMRMRAPVPQLDRGAVYETECCGFKSRRARLQDRIPAVAGSPRRGPSSPFGVTMAGEGGVGPNTEGLIEERSLHEFQEALVTVLQWNE
jgi:hypothetical protein